MSPISDMCNPQEKTLTVNRTALALIALAIGFNLPYLRLAQIFDYPAILRAPSQTILLAFADGGAGLIVTWYAFALAALAFVPVGMAHALGSGRVQRRPDLAVAAALAAALAGLLQAMGLLRWVLVVPGLAERGDVEGFALIHAYAGVALGEHLGQLMTALHVTLMAALQSGEARRKTALLGGLTAGAITIGAMEGIALSLGADGTPFGLTAVAGYILLTVWMIASGISLLPHGLRQIGTP
jgi:Domain of unknown function (DUF4386)